MTTEVTLQVYIWNDVGPRGKIGGVTERVNECRINATAGNVQGAKDARRSTTRVSGVVCCTVTSWWFIGCDGSAAGSQRSCMALFHCDGRSPVSVTGSDVCHLLHRFCRLPSLSLGLDQSFVSYFVDDPINPVE